MSRNIRYFLAISILTIAGISPASAADKPNAPTAVTVDSATPLNANSARGSVSVAWNKGVVDASHPIPVAYIISATASGQPSVSVTFPVASPTTSSFTSVVESLTGGIEYKFVVTAKASNEEVASAAEVPYTPKSIPNDPIPGSAIAAPTSAILSWTAPTNRGGLSLTKYVISDSATVNIDITDVSLTTYTVTGLTASQTYKLFITAHNSIGKSATVNFADVTVPSAPGVPTTVTATSGTSNVAVSWVAPVSTGGSSITGYKVSLFNDSGTRVGAEQSTSVVNYDFTSVAAGTYTVKVKATNIVGDSDFSLASNAVTIATASAKLANVPMFSPTTLPNLVIGGSQAFTVTVPSNETVTVTATGNPAGSCTYAAGVVTAVAEGTCTVRATSPSTADYDAASGTKTFTVTKTLQTITFAAITNKTMPGPLTISATSTSGLTVSFTASGACTISGNVVTFLNTGSCSIVAAQSGNASFAAATSVTRDFSILAALSPDSGGGGGGGGGGSSGGGGGGSSGGGVGPGPTPSISPTPTPSPSPSVAATPTPTPTVSASATPTPSPSATASASASPSPSPTSRPGVTTNARGEVTKTTTFAIPAKVTGPVKSLILTGSKATVSTSLKSAVRPSIPSVKKGTVVKVVIRGADGKSYTVASTTAKSTGTYKAPAIKFSKPGTYQVTVMIGKIKKVITYKITK